jgi:hypothetical protein
MAQLLRHASGRSIVPLCLALGLWGLSCKNPAEPDHAPVISNLRFSPAFVLLKEGGGTTSITGTVDFVDDNGDLTALRLTAPGGIDVTIPIGGAAGVKRGTIQGLVSVSTATAGTYTFEVWVFDSQGASSNRLSGLFEVRVDDNGGRWTEGPVLATGPLNKIIWAGSQFVIVGVNGLVFTSPDATTWTARASGTTSALADVVWGGSQLVAVGEGETILTSTDGITWTSRYTTKPNTMLEGVAWSGTKFVAAGSDLSSTAAAILTSADGVVWDPIPAQFTNATLFAVTWAGNKFVAVGNEAASPNRNLILTSSDGISWNRQTVPSSYGLYDVLWNGDKIVAAGVDVVLVSADGQNWTSSGVPSRINGLAWSGSRFLGVGFSVQSSTDGLLWTGTQGPFGLQSVVWHGQQYVAVNWTGQVFLSP